jgi:predicted patatin/cPLA2 family phospholipase
MLPQAIFLLVVPLLYYCGNAELNQLSFSGGGALGAVEIGIAKRILEKDDTKHYNLYTGISAGALNAGFLSYFFSIKDGIDTAEKIYSTLKNHDVYKVLPTTKISLLNTEPLFNTLSQIINNMHNEPVVHTLIGATNLYSGNLDVYSFENNDNANKVHLLMSSSAIPALFPPISYNGNLYADGGVLSNELLQVEHSGRNEYINITYITPSEGYIYDDTPIDSLKEMIKRTISIVTSNFDDPLVSLNQNCKTPIGEINKYFVDSKHLDGYNMLNFDKGAELIEIGYQNVEHKKYVLC